jgi:thioredoxin reductase
MSSDAPIIVVGAGPAGLACAIRLGTAHLPVVIVEGTLPGGQLWEFDDVGSLPGVDVRLTGNDLAARLQEQAAAADVGFEFARVLGTVAVSDQLIEVQLEGGGTLRGRGVVAATGATRTPIVPRQGPPVDESLTTHCIPCDGPLLAGTDVAFIGTRPPLARDLAAVQPFARSTVVICPPGHDLPASEVLVGGARLLQGEVVSIARQDSLFEIHLDTDHEPIQLSAAALVPCMGYQPASSWLAGDVLDAGGWVIGSTLGRQQWAAGSVTAQARAGTTADVIADGWRVGGLVEAALLEAATTVPAGQR